VPSCLKFLIWPLTGLAALLFWFTILTTRPRHHMAPINSFFLSCRQTINHERCFTCSTAFSSLFRVLEPFLHRVSFQMAVFGVLSFSRGCDTSASTLEFPLGQVSVFLSLRLRAHRGCVSPHGCSVSCFPFAYSTSFGVVRPLSRQQFKRSPLFFSFSLSAPPE